MIITLLLGSSRVLFRFASVVLLHVAKETHGLGWRYLLYRKAVYFEGTDGLRVIIVLLGAVPCEGVLSFAWVGDSATIGEALCLRRDLLGRT